MRNFSFSEVVTFSLLAPGGGTASSQVPRWRTNNERNGELQPLSTQTHALISSTCNARAACVCMSVSVQSSVYVEWCVEFSKLASFGPTDVTDVGPPGSSHRYHKSDNSVRSTGGAVKVKNAKGEYVLQKVKVKR